MYICSVSGLLCIIFCAPLNQLWAPAAQVPVQWDLVIRHTDRKKHQELHPEMEPECHMPREIVCYQSKNQLILM